MDEWSDNELAGFASLQIKTPQLVFPSYQTPASAFSVILLQLPVTALWSCVQHPGKHLSSELLILVQGFLTYLALEFAKARNWMHFWGCRITKMYGMMATTLIPLCLLHHQEAYEAEARLLSGWELRAINHNSESACCSYLRGIKQEVITISSPH
jgi:hypothetical protein